MLNESPLYKLLATTIKYAVAGSKGSEVFRVHSLCRSSRPLLHNNDKYLGRIIDCSDMHGLEYVLF